MKLGKQTVHLARALDIWRQIEFFMAILQFIAGLFAISVQPFLRKDFGERHLSWLNLFFGYTVAVNFALFGGLAGIGTGSGFSFLMLFLWLAFVVVSLYHRYEIWRKNRSGAEWHSYYMGTSLLPLPFSQEATYKWIEPALVFVLGLVLVKFTPVVGIWLLISAASLLLYSHLTYYYLRQTFLDMRDGRIESRYMGDALAGRPARQTGGFVIAESNLQMVRHDAGLKAAFAALSSDLRSIIEPTDALMQARNMKDALAQSGAAS